MHLQSRPLVAMVLLAVALLSPLKIHAVEANFYAELLSTYLAGMSTLSARFEQTTIDQSAYDTTTYGGQLWIEKPNRFRVDTVNPAIQTLVSNGTDFWSYDEDLEQVVISKLNTDLSEVPILLFSSDIRDIQKAYNISGYSDERDESPLQESRSLPPFLLEHFVLEPLSDLSLFQSLTLSFYLGKPVSITINATTGETTTISLYDIVLNSVMPAERFILVVPPGADVIDDRR